MRISKCLMIGFIIFPLFLAPALAGEKQEKPVVMVMINEQIWAGDNIVYDYYGNLSNIVSIWTSVSQTDTTLISAFLEKGFKVVRGGVPNVNKGNVTKQNILNAIEGDDFTSTNLGQYLKADVVIVGKAVARSAAMLAKSKQQSARANINVRAIRVDTGEIIAVEGGEATAVAIDEISAGVDAIKKVASTLAENLIAKISQVYSDQRR